jgi:hypothetical protein
MGRWLEKLANMPNTIVTEPTEPCFVSSVTSHLELTQKNSLIVMGFVRQCSIGMNAHPQEIIDCLLAVEDEHDIINGLLPADALRLHIKLWIAQGKPYYSGKQFS